MSQAAAAAAAARARAGVKERKSETFKNILNNIRKPKEGAAMTDQQLHTPSPAGTPATASQSTNSATTTLTPADGHGGDHSENAEELLEDDETIEFEFDDSFEHSYEEIIVEDENLVEGEEYVEVIEEIVEDEEEDVVDDGSEAEVTVEEGLPTILEDDKEYNDSLSLIDTASLVGSTSSGVTETVSEADSRKIRPTLTNANTGGKQQLSDRSLTLSQIVEGSPKTTKVVRRVSPAPAAPAPAPAVPNKDSAAATADPPRPPPSPGMLSPPTSIMHEEKSTGGFSAMTISPLPFDDHTDSPVKATRPKAVPSPTPAFASPNLRSTPKAGEKPKVQLNLNPEVKPLPFAMPQLRKAFPPKVEPEPPKMATEPIVSPQVKDFWKSKDQKLTPPKEEADEEAGDWKGLSIWKEREKTASLSAPPSPAPSSPQRAARLSLSASWSQSPSTIPHTGVRRSSLPSSTLPLSPSSPRVAPVSERPIGTTHRPPRPPSLSMPSSPLQHRSAHSAVSQASSISSTASNVAPVPLSLPSPGRSTPPQASSAALRAAYKRSASNGSSSTPPRPGENSGAMPSSSLSAPNTPGNASTGGSPTSVAGNMPDDMHSVCTAETERATNMARQQRKLSLTGMREVEIPTPRNRIREEDEFSEMQESVCEGDDNNNKDDYDDLNISKLSGHSPGSSRNNFNDSTLTGDSVPLNDSMQSQHSNIMPTGSNIEIVMEGDAEQEPHEDDDDDSDAENEPDIEWHGVESPKADKKKRRKSVGEVLPEIIPESYKSASSPKPMNNSNGVSPRRNSADFAFPSPLVQKQPLADDPERLAKKQEKEKRRAEREKRKEAERLEKKQKAREKRRKQCRRLCLVFFCLAALAAVIVIMLTLLNENNNDGDDGTTDNGGDGSDAPNNRSTNAPTVAPQRDVLYTTLQILQGGSALAFGSDSVFALGDPSGLGETRIYDRVASTITKALDDTWVEQLTLTGSEMNGLFGSAVDMSRQQSTTPSQNPSRRRPLYLRSLAGNNTSENPMGMIVGAPGVSGDASTKDAGEAFYYEYIPISGGWKQIGESIKGNQSQAEMFGSSVAISTSDTPRRVVIGAPKNGLVGTDSGRVYVFEYVRPLGAPPYWSLLPGMITGQNAREKLGSSVDVSSDGSSFLVGAPGGNYFQFFSLQSQSLSKKFEDSGLLPGESFGSSVVFISDDCFVVGGPDAQSGAGVVRVYQYQSFTGVFRRFPADIIGKEGERIGEVGTVSGLMENGQPVVLVGTITGLVKRFDFNVTEGQWVERFVSLATDLSGPVSSVSAVGSSTFAASSKVGDRTVIFTLSSTQAPSSTDVPTTQQPTSSLAPTAIPSPWSISATLSADPNVGFGSAVALSGSTLVVGAPDFNSSGAFYTYVKNASGWVLSDQLSSTIQGGRFGSTVSLSSASVLVVGAPQALVPGSSEFGAAMYYQRMNGKWLQAGSILRPSLSPNEVNGAFGYAVAAARGARRVVCGAPKTNVMASDGLKSEAGRVYTFQFNASTSNWSRMETQPIVGANSGDRLGVAVAMSSDGSRFLVGAPANDGMILYYEWTGTTWNLILPLPATTAGEAFGSSVAILSDDGTTIAVGGPRYQGGKGVIRVYKQQSTSGPFLQVGPDIIGEEGDELGAENSIAGTNGRFAAGTANGNVKSFQYDGITDVWRQLIDPITVESGVASLSTGAGSNSVAVGTDTKVVEVFDLVLR